MAFYNTCPLCGANLDPGEACDCGEERERKQEFFSSHLKMEAKARQMVFVFDREVCNESKSYC